MRLASIELHRAASQAVNDASATRETSVVDVRHGHASVDHATRGVDHATRGVGHAARSVGRADRGVDRLAELDRWRARNRYYHSQIERHLQFAVPGGESILLLGCEDGAALAALRPARGVGVDRCPQLVEAARRRHPELEFAVAADYAVERAERFDCVLLNDITGAVDDLFTLLGRVRRLCRDDGRVVIVQHNYLWRPVLRMAEKLGLKRPDATPNLLSAGDLRVLLGGAGFEVTDVRAKLFCPLELMGLGRAINRVAGLIPVIHRLACVEIIVARPVVVASDAVIQRKGASVVLTVRDERENIEPMVKSLPPVGAATEILFVEGHSTDGTLEEIERVQRAYPERNIRLLVQDGIGQGDAIRKGFGEARGEVIVLLEADQTSPAEDVLKAFDVVASGRADFVNGSRFIYPRESGSMPWLNVAGNWLFAIWFTWFLGRRTSDVLCGIKAIDRRQFDRMGRNWGFLGVDDPFGDFELIFGAARLGLRIGEVPTRYRSRKYGRPKTKFFSHGWMLLRMAMRATVVFRCR